MELVNNTSGRHGVYHTAQTEPHNNQPQDISRTSVSAQHTDQHVPAQDVYCSPARSLCMDIQAMTHYSMAQIAKLCDIPLSTFYRLAMGTTRNPLYKTFDKLVRTYFMVLLEHSQLTTGLN